jgi:sugar/nucleoside kinase (ribokinase family)
VHLAFSPVACRAWLPRLAAWRREGITTSWDSGWNEQLVDDPDFTALLGAVDYVMMNEQEALLFSRTRTIARAVKALRETTRTTILKFGPRGSRWISADADLSVPAPRVRTLDTTGAGDVFNGGFLAARLGGASPRQALAAGNRVGAESTRALGGIEGLR